MKAGGRGRRSAHNTHCEYIYCHVLPSVLWRCWLDGRKGIWSVKTEWWGAGVVACLERGADLHMAQLMPLPLTVSCFSKILIGFTFLVPAHLGSPGKGPLNGCVLLPWPSVVIALPSFVGLLSKGHKAHNRSSVPEGEYFARLLALISSYDPLETN